MSLSYDLALCCFYSKCSATYGAQHRQYVSISMSSPPKAYMVDANPDQEVTSIHINSWTTLLSVVAILHTPSPTWPFLYDGHGFAKAHLEWDLPSAIFSWYNIQVGAIIAESIQKDKASATKLLSVNHIAHVIEIHASFSCSNPDEVSSYVPLLIPSRWYGHSFPGIRMKTFSQ